MCMHWTQYWDGLKRHGCSADNKADSLSVRGKVWDSSASMKSFQMEGIKHFLSISCWLSLSPTPPSSTLPLSSSLSASFKYKSLYFGPRSANFPFPTPILTAQKLHKHLLDKEHSQSKHTHCICSPSPSHRPVINSRASGLCLMKRHWRSVWLEGRRAACPSKTSDRLPRHNFRLWKLE